MTHPAPPPLSRREFLTFSAAVAALLGLPGCFSLPRGPRRARRLAPGARIRIAQIGCGGKGYSDIRALRDEEVVALCDIDWEGRPVLTTQPDGTKVPGPSNVHRLMEEFPQARRYTDFRKMLHEMDDQIDAVSIATPDHMHFLPAYLALMLGKHVYVQKPLTQTVGEARELLRLARLTGACTQMGNQGHAGEGIRLVREWFEAGLLGDVREVKIWTNRPIWPQGLAEWPAAEPVPPGLAWDEFIGRSRVRPFSRKIHPFNWRGYREYGCGALGDMACHLMDAAYWGLQLRAPESVELTRARGATDISFPTSAVVTYRFPARGALPPVVLTWHEGGEKPDRPPQLEAGRELARGGQLLIGSRGTVYDDNDYCNNPRFLPDSYHEELAAGGKLPPRRYPRPDPIGNPYLEWTRAIRANDPGLAGSNFEYAVPFTEMVCLGTMAIGVGRKFTWDAAAMITNLPEANALLYPTYRPGWTPRDLA